MTLSEGRLSRLLLLSTDDDGKKPDIRLPKENQIRTNRKVKVYSCTNKTSKVYNVTKRSNTIEKERNVTM